MKDPSGTNRAILDHEFRSTLPFPVATAFYQYQSSSIAGALRAQRLFLTFESTIRYASVLGIADYSTTSDPASDVLSFFRELLFPQYKRGLSLGTWVQVLHKVLREADGSRQDIFIPEFNNIDPKWLSDIINPVVERRNEITHGETISALAYKSIIQNFEPNLYAFLKQFQFLSRYNLCVMPLDYSTEEPGMQGTVGLHLCKGSSANFYEVLVKPSGKIPVGTPFVWNKECSKILTLEPFYILGRNEYKKQNTGTSIAIEGLMVCDGQRHFRSVNQEANLAVNTMQHPPMDILKSQFEHVLTRSQITPSRQIISLGDEDKQKLSSRPGDLPDGAELTGGRDTYRILGQPIAHGGMSTVYLTRRESDETVCALKVMPLVMNSQPALVKRFTREGRIARGLESENIVIVLDTGFSHAHYFIVMEYINGGSLADEIWQRSGQDFLFTVEEAVGFIRQIANGLRTIHSRGLVHRDLKPSNIMLELGNNKTNRSIPVAKITDFGLVRRMDEQSAVLTATLDQLGTFEYMAPEQFHGKNADIDHRADIYALGKISCILLTGKLPKDNKSVGNIDFSKIAGAEETNKSGEGFRQIILKCMSDKPVDRFPNIQSFLGAIDRLDELEDSCSFLKLAGINIPNVRVAYSMAKIGHKDAESQLHTLVAEPSDVNLHHQASIALSGLPGGVSNIVNKIGYGSPQNINDETKNSLVRSLRHIISFHEAIAPTLLGKHWLRSLSFSIKFRLLMSLIINSFREERSKFWEAVLSFSSIGAAAGGITGVVCSIFGSSVFWKFSPAAAPHIAKIIANFVPALVCAFIWGALCSMTGWLGSKFPRPYRYFALISGGLFVSLLLGVVYAVLCWTAFNHFPSVQHMAPDFIEAAGYLGFLSGAGLCTALTINELPSIQKRRPNFLLSISIFSGFHTLFVTPTLFWLLTRYTFYEALYLPSLAIACGLGAGIASWVQDKKYNPNSVHPRTAL